MSQDTTQWKHCLEHAAVSDVGLRRSNNQDSMAVLLADGEKTWREQGHLFIVADGMGAHAAGELASQLAVDHVCTAYERQQTTPSEALRGAVIEANTQIHNRGQANEEYRGMGTTISTLVLLPQGALVAHLGDSRVYRLRKHQFEQLTFDHSLVWEVCAAEGISEAEAPGYIPRNVITRSAGPNAEVQVDLEGLFPLEVGDAFLLCSDGLSGLVRDHEMGTILGCLPVGEALQTLVDLAILRGGPDNITGVAAQVIGPEMIGPDPATASNGGFFGRMRPMAWGILAVFILILFGLTWLALSGNPFPALAGLVGVSAVALAALMARQPKPEPELTLGPQLLGKGPHTRFDCTPNEAFVAHLANLLTELRTTADNRNWIVDWDQVGNFDERAHAAAQANDCPQAVREYCHALSFVTNQLRNQPAQEAPTDDTSLGEGQTENQ